MCSKWLRLVGIILSVALTLGCAGEDQEYQPPPEIDLKGKTQCLSEASSTILRYVEGDLTAQELHEFWSCTGQAVETFLADTEGRQKDRYTAKELRRFMERFFLGDLRISDSLLHELMEIKRVFVGGRVTDVTRSELHQTLDLLKKFAGLTLKLRPYMKTFTRGGGKGASPEPGQEKLEKALGTLEEVAFGLGHLLEHSEQGYSFARLEALLLEVGKFYEGEDDSFDRAVKLIPLASQVKSLVVAPPAKEISADQWGVLFSSLARIYGLWVRLGQVAGSEYWSEPDGLQQIDRVFSGIESLLLASLHRRPQQSYPFHELAALFREMETQKLLPEGFTAEVLKGLLPVISQRLFPSKKAKENESKALHVGHIQSFFFELDLWVKAQMRIHDVVRAQSWEAPVQPGQEVAAEAIKRAAGEAPWPLIVDDKNRLLFLQPEDRLKSFYDHRSLTSLNWQRAIVRLLVRGYAEDLGRRQALFGLSQDELGRATQDLFPLLVSVGFLAPGDEDIYETIFQEGNLFMPRTQPDSWPTDQDAVEYLSFSEGLEYMSFVLSGVSASQVMTEVLFTEKQDKIPSHDFRKGVSKHREMFLKHLPALRNYLAKVQKDVWPRYERYLEIAVRAEGDSDELPVTSGEMMEMWVLLQYIESFFARFDLDHSGTISLREALKAYPIFKGILRPFFGDDEKEMKAFFTYLLKTGENPFEDLGGPVKYLNWKWHPEKWSLEADRLRVAQIISILAQF